MQGQAAGHPHGSEDRHRWRCWPTATTASRCVGPNDVTIDGKGRLYFTDLAGAAVYRIDAPGKVARILAAPDIQRPNGIQVSPDDTTLYLDRSQ